MHLIRRLPGRRRDLRIIQLRSRRLPLRLCLRAFPALVRRSGRARVFLRRPGAGTGDRRAAGTAAEGLVWRRSRRGAGIWVLF